MTPSGTHSSNIKVTGAQGEEPTVTMKSPFDVTVTERSVVRSGEGSMVMEGDLVSATYAAYNAESGKVLELSPGSTWAGTKFLVDKENSFPGIYKALLCSRVGDRIVAAIPSNDLFGGLGVDMSAAGIGPTDTLVMIFDIEAFGPPPSATPTPTESTPAVPLPTPAEWVQDVPTVSMDDTVPVVTLPATAPRPDLELKVINSGDGALVTADSTVTIDYQGTSWDTGTIFDQSYTRGDPSTFPVGGVIKGFAAAMVGQQVGATVLVTIPPALGYGEGAINDNNLVGQTLVFLIQIHDVN